MICGEHQTGFHYAKSRTYGWAGGRARAFSHTKEHERPFGERDASINHVHFSFIGRRDRNDPPADADGLPPERDQILTLRWEHVKLDRVEIRIVNGKTGNRTVHSSPSAVDVHAALPRKAGNPWVIPGAKPGKHMTNIDGAWQSIRAPAGLHDARIHDIRHSFASRALALGESLPMIGKLLGHTQVQTTARYAHLGRNSVKVAAIRISDSLKADMDTPPVDSAAP